MLLPQQVHGYRNGHQLLVSSVRLDREDQNLVDRLSDLSGPLQPGQSFEPYLTTYPLPSGKSYVLARTWQDLEAVRAGCVLTRSLIVPAADWISSPDVAFLATLLKELPRVTKDLEDAEVNPHHIELPPVNDRRTDELVEALFLERRQPIVIFEAPEAEVIVLRLLTALWPGLRRQFATCTFSLASRSISGKPLDLQFAPKAARNRFADWKGRRIEVSAPSPPRHRWTELASRQIFQSVDASLSSFDSLGVLRADSRGDEGALRLSLLWNELLEKADTSPTAVLGLLDIAHSEVAPKSISRRRLVSTIDHAIELSRGNSSAGDHLRFLSTLLGKYREQPAPLHMLRVARKSAEEVAVSSPLETMTYVSDSDTNSVLLPRILCSGIATGLAHRSDGFSDKWFSGLGADIRLRLTSSSKEFASAFVESLARNPSVEWEVVLTSTLEYRDQTLRSRVRRLVLPRLNQGGQRPLLESLLKDLTGDELLLVVQRLWISNQLSIPEFDEPVLRSASAAHARAELRDFVARLPPVRDTDRILQSILQFDTADLGWICSFSLQAERRTNLLVSLMSAAHDNLVERVFQDQSLSKAVLNNLSDNSEHVAIQAARVITFGNLTWGDSFEEGLKVLANLSGATATQLAFFLVRGIFSNPVDISKVQRALPRFLRYVSPADLVALACRRELPASKLGENVVLLERSSREIRNRIVEIVDSLCERLVATRKVELDSEGVHSLTALIADANGATQVRAAEFVLPFALRMKHTMASPLVVATFPIVHRELARASNPAPFITFFAFSSWDRCEMLRRDLVEGYLHSSWPPADLLVAASAAGVVEKVLDHLFRKFGGAAYFNAIEGDLDRLPRKISDPIRREMETHARR